MTSISDIVLQPLLPISILWALAALTAAFLALSLLRGLKGAWLRILAATTLFAALLDPALVAEEREPLPDIVALVVDDTASQSIEDRREVAQAAADRVTEQVEALSAARGGRAPIELRTVRVRDAGDEGSLVLGALAEALADAPSDQVAGAIVVSDGAVDDADRTLPLFQGEDPPPLHVLLTGRADEFDRRLVVENAPRFGVVGEPVTLRFRVEQRGDGDRLAGSPIVRIFVDGEPVNALRAPVGPSIQTEIEISHGGSNVVEIRMDALPGELTERNNAAAFSVNGVRDRLRVLLVSGEPYAGERTWRNLLKSDPSVDLVHFTILRPPNKFDQTPRHELALIFFPTQELFELKLREFDLIVFDRFRNWPNVLNSRYLNNIADYVEEGGAVLVASGPAFATRESLSRTPLARVLPVEPTFDVVETPFRPAVTEVGDRHPVTRRLKTPTQGAAEAEAEGDRPWGRWFRQVDVEALRGDTVMRGAEDRPLLVMDRVGEGRVAVLTSDHAWLWARGYDGGGPQAELLRRLSHWLMQEPELDEEALIAEVAPGGFAIVRRSLETGDKQVRVAGPDGAVTTVTLEPLEPGVWRAAYETEALGLFRLEDAAPVDGEVLSTIAVVGPAAPKEFADPVSTPARLAEAVAASGGGALRLGSSDALAHPDIRRVRPGRTAADADAGWIGIARREAYRVTGVSLASLAPSWALFALSAMFVVAAWRVEGR